MLGTRLSLVGKFEEADAFLNDALTHARAGGKVFTIAQRRSSLESRIASKCSSSAGQPFFVRTW
jgi:hypothetical protein